MTVIATISVAFAGELEFSIKKVEYELDGKTYESRVVGPADTGGHPAIFMVPNWMGATDHAVEKAERVSDGRFLVYVADVYGKDVRPANADEAGVAAGALRADRAEMRKRTNAALAHFRSIAGNHGTDPQRMAAIGFCFGGGAILEMARSGADARAFVSFHGDLVSPTLAVDSGKIRGKVLVLHGAADPFVPADDVAAFEKAMGETEVDWTFVSYGGAVHSFSDPTANMEGRAMYCERTAQRAFRAMWSSFEEVLAD